MRLGHLFTAQWPKYQPWSFVLQPVMADACTGAQMADPFLADSEFRALKLGTG